MLLNMLDQKLAKVTVADHTHTTHHVYKPMTRHYFKKTSAPMGGKGMFTCRHENDEKPTDGRIGMKKI